MSYDLNNLVHSDYFLPPICHMPYIVMSFHYVFFYPTCPVCYYVLFIRIATTIRCVISFILSCPPLCFILSCLFWLLSFIRNGICIIVSCPPAICAFIICVLSYFICLVHSDFIRCVISFILSCSPGMWSFILSVLFFILSCQFWMRPPIRCAICFRLSCPSK